METEVQSVVPSCCWNKQIIFTLNTDYNVDGAVHTQLFLMNKNGLLTEYIVDLVKKDLEQNESPVLDERFREKIALKEMGYRASLDEDEMEKALAKCQFLIDFSQLRQEALAVEADNIIANGYVNGNSVNNTEPKKTTQTVDYSSSIERLRSNPEENAAIDNLMGL